VYTRPVRASSEILRIFFTPVRQRLNRGNRTASTTKVFKPQPGGSVKAEGLGDGFTHATDAIAKLRLTLPPTT